MGYLQVAVGKVYNRGVGSSQVEAMISKDGKNEKVYLFYTNGKRLELVTEPPLIKRCSVAPGMLGAD